MKAVVLEKRGKSAAVLCKDGKVLVTDDCGYRIGEEININVSASFAKAKSKASMLRPLIAAASIFAACLGGGAGAYYIPAGTVSLDVNPSIEYRINIFDRVISASGVNDDGQAIISSIDKSDLVGLSIDDAVENTLKEIRQEGYFAEEENYVVIAADAGPLKDTDKLTKELSERVDAHEDLSPIAKSVSKEDFKRAHSEGTTPGKIMVVDMLEETEGEEIDRDEWLHVSVNNIMREYNRRMGDGKLPEETSDEMPQNGDESEKMPKEGDGLKNLPSDEMMQDGTEQDTMPQNGNEPNGMPQNGNGSNEIPQNGNESNGMPKNNDVPDEMPQNGLMTDDRTEGGMQDGISQNGGMQEDMTLRGEPPQDAPSNGMMQDGAGPNGMVPNGMTQNGEMPIQTPR